MSNLFTFIRELSRDVTHLLVFSYSIYFIYSQIKFTIFNKFTVKIRKSLANHDKTDKTFSIRSLNFPNVTQKGKIFPLHLMETFFTFQ